MRSCEHEQLKTRRRKSRDVSSRFLSPSSSPDRTNSTSISSSNKQHHNNNNSQNVHPNLRNHDRVRFGSSESTKENHMPSPWIDDEDNVILPGRFSVDESALYRATSRRTSCSLLYESYNDESDSELSDVSFASTLTTSCPSRNHKRGINVSSKYLNDLRPKPSKGSSSQGHNNDITKLRPQEYSLLRTNSFRGTESTMMKRTTPLSRYGSSMSRWALSPGRSLENQTPTSPKSNMKPPRAKGVSKLFNFGLDFFRSKKSTPASSPLKPKTCDPEAAHQLKLMSNRLVQWRFVNARTSAAKNNVVSREKKQLLCAWDTVTKLRQLVLQERIKLQKKKLEMKLYHVLLSQVKHLEAWEDTERKYFSSLTMTRQALHSVLSRIPLREGAKVNIESAVTSFQKVEAVIDAIISTVNSFAPTMEDVVPFASQLGEVVAEEKLMLEQCHDLLRSISELEVQERSLKCCFLIQQRDTLDTKLVKTRNLISHVSSE